MSTAYSAGSFSTAGGTSGTARLTLGSNGSMGIGIATGGSSSWVNQSIIPNSITFTTPNEWAMRITPELKIEVNPNVSIDDAAKAVLEAVQNQLNITLPRTPDWHDLSSAEIYALMEQFECVSLEVRTLIMRVVEKLKEKNHEQTN